MNAQTANEVIRHENTGGTAPAVIAQAAVAFTWAGLVLGLSFIETPLKFQAPGISEVLGVGIGRLVFSTLNRIEAALTILLLAMLWMEPLDRMKWGLFGIVAAIVLLQTLWLLPLLDTRAQLLLDGNPAPPSFHHLLFIGVEAVKLLVLFTLGIVAVRRKA